MLKKKQHLKGQYTQKSHFFKQPVKPKPDQILTSTTHHRERTIGIMGAMPEETNGIVQLIQDASEHRLGGRSYYTGQIDGINVVVAFSRWGKVAAAITTSTMIIRFGVTELIFTGVAGGIAPDLRIGDIVIGNKVIQHDMDARPLMRRFEIPMLKKDYIDTCNVRTPKAFKTISEFIQQEKHYDYLDRQAEREFGIIRPAVYLGAIASGDKFISLQQDKQLIKELLPEVTCIEMEGAAVGQVCHEHNIPYMIIRIISDLSDEKSEINFPLFIEHISSKYAKGIIKTLFADSRLTSSADR